ncbi:hypothetical protein GPECTOR_2g1207 [Gonium pectorale]|uniref:Uncharacterized protein n=1 Tax=Gonium pectorale TaxID=33097 RepID=A0A150H0G1_GONPE|nr:hypothetical protein GPECTOR_2g1207 [Gonium pectorale]|eukprot:KXZ55657.1 hypothetical protein GPECTOR_2g1207 [Gonium pectorale]
MLSVAAATTAADAIAKAKCAAAAAKVAALAAAAEAAAEAAAAASVGGRRAMDLGALPASSGRLPSPRQPGDGAQPSFEQWASTDGGSNEGSGNRL